MLLNWNKIASEIHLNDELLSNTYSIRIAIQNPSIAIYRDMVLLGDTRPCNFMCGSFYIREQVYIFLCTYVCKFCACELHLCFLRNQNTYPKSFTIV